MASARNEDKTILEAETIFLLMKKGFPISRNVRAQWLLEHLDSVISIQCSSIKNKEIPELEVISVLPKDKPPSWSIDTSYQFLYKVVSTTSIIFVAHKYRIVFSLDLSPSLATVDIQNGEIVIDEVCLATKRCLEGITKPFMIPGSKRIMQPEIYVTVIAHTPFFTTPAQQVLVQGWLITADNVNSLTQYIEKQLCLLEERVATVTSIANQQLENLRAESERLVGRLFEESNNCLNKNNCNISIVSPEASFVNMLRYGMLALTLLPEHSCAHMIIVTDGIVGIKNAQTLDSIIQQLRATTVACSFLCVGSTYDPHCADGLVPYQDLLYFIAAATLGSYISFTSYIVPAHATDMNFYHKHFLCWQLYRDIFGDDTSDRHLCWRTENNCFHGHKTGQLLRKKQIDDKVTCTLSSLLCCRLREGYLIKKASVRDDILEINFVLLWKTNVFLEYLVTCPWSTKSLSLSNVIQYTITIEAPYEFLHDITCLSKKPLNSHYRQSVISRFWTALTSLTESDNMLAHFSWFPGSGWTWYSVPDTIRSGMPVFYLSSYPSPSTVQLSDAACPQFGQIWQPVVSLDPLQWARWMHTQRITLILAYDRPLPRHLHQANQSGRFQCVQSRQAAAVLYAMLKNWATFVLVENHTYVQFIYREAEKPPVSFSLIRINCKALCVVLNIAFAGGTEGVVRHNVVVDLVERLSKLTLPNRPTEQREIPCCTIIHKSLERILVRYERIPSNLSMVVFPDGTQPTCTRTALGLLGSSLTTTLSRYLYHNRWLWHVKRPFVQTIPGITLPRLNITAIARILSTITKIRLGEGFNFAYSAAGITNMVLEVQMQGFGNDENSYPCIIQYVLFPPHVVPNAALERDSGTEDDTEEGIGEAEVWTEDSEGYSDFQIVTEVWVEPQCGYVQMPTQSTAIYMHPLQYHQLHDAIARIDEECINALLTLEYLSLLCQAIPAEKDTEIVFGQAHQGVRYHGLMGISTDRISECPNPTEPLEATPIIDERIHPMYFSFDTLSILSKCQQAELLFSMFADDSMHIEEDRDSANRILMGNFLEHMKQLHNKELLFTSAESQRFTRMLLSRPRENNSPLPFFMQGEKNYKDDASDIYPRWKCFVKGISTTHVIITILPATEKDVRLITYTGDNCTSNNSEKICDSDIFDLDINEKISSPTSYTKDTNLPDFLTLERRESKSSNQFITARSNGENNFGNTDNETSLIIPVYVYDCSLALLIDALVGQLQMPQNKDIYQDHTFKIGEQICEDFISLKSESNTKPSSPEPKSEDSDNISSDQRSLMEHCKLLSLAHCHCYVVAVYKSLALQQSLSYEDMESAVAQCEENLIEINITNYLRSVCRHLSMLPEDGLLDQLKISACNNVKPLHSLIKNEFKKIMAIAFRPVPAHPEFYYCLPSWMSEKLEVASQRTDSDDDLDEFTCHSEMPAPKTDNSSNQVSQAVNITWPATNLHNEKLSRCNSKDSLTSDFEEENTWNTKDQPLFLHLSCSIRFRSELCSIPVKLMPTCFTEIIQRINDGKERNLVDLSPDDLKATLDIICLNLPREVLEVSLERYPALRTTSYCSGSPVGSMPSGCSPDANAKNESMQERLPQPPQHHAVISLKDDIEWLLRNETATALLDHPSPSADTLRFIAQHVSDSIGKPSCLMDKVPLHFVFSSESSVPKFLKELKSLVLLDKYCICQEADLFYITKKPEIIISHAETDTLHVDIEESEIKEDENIENAEQEDMSTMIQINGQDSGDAPGYYSEISSIAEGKHGTDDGYEGDSSNSDDDYQWLIELDRRRDRLPNFWLILSVESNHVNVYFHCRFLELSSSEVDCYLQIQKMLLTQIKDICRRVNQYLLLQNLHDTRICDPLLEAESTEDYNNTWRGESSSESGNLFQNHTSSASSNVIPGMFRCPVIWEEPFNLHPRLKTGPGRSGLSRGIKALHAVLNRLSVNNRNNMFVYQENNENVFYLRLHEQTNDGKPLQNKLSESDEKLVVSRSNSVASLSQAKGIGSLTNDHAISSDTRPRVRSFGEKESDILNRTGDSIILMVHGISEAGPEVKRDLVQVLQNRLDDAVLEVLSVMLARNPMCKLTPADVHFIQKPYKSPECIVQLSVQPHCLPYINALGYYLRQNILQFLYIPKYTDVGTHYHFQDYSSLDGVRRKVSESDIFLYNQSHSSGSKGIACIALAIIDGKGESVMDDYKSNFPKLFRVENFENIVSTIVYDHKSEFKPNAEALIEFRIWKQGRVNLESLILKLSSAVKHGTWDLVTEYNLLATSLTESIAASSSPVAMITETTVENKSAQTPVKTSQSQIIVDNLTINQYELGEEGKLNEIYHTTLAQWFQFALEMGVPAVKKHEVIIHHRHAIPVIVRELQNLIRCQDPDTSSKVFVLQDRQPFLNQHVISHKASRWSADIRNSSNQSAAENTNLKSTNSPIYVPHEFNKDEQTTYIKCLLVARNFHQWKASLSKEIDPELLAPKDQKQLQKFNPLISESNFVPRQRILLAEITSDNIIIYMYNWSKEKSEKLIKQTTNLGTWLSSRSSLFTNIIMQKLGIFHHKFTREPQHREHSSQYYQINDMENLAKFPSQSNTDNKDWPRSSNRAQSTKNNAFSWTQMVGQAMRDAKPNASHPHNTTDAIVKAAYDLQDLRHREKKIKEDLEKLYAMWQSRTPNIPISLNALNTFIQHSRLIHFCHTPLLFLPSWRLQSAATRDHSLTPPQASSNFNLNGNVLHQQSPQATQSKREATNAIIIKWHQELCKSMLSEYKQYLQILGFNPIQVESPHKTDEEHAQQQHQSYYLKKSMLGGILLFEIHLLQPFFIVKLHIIECNRLQTKTSSGMMNQFVLSFVDVCDKIQINMHLHSFTYDFHLRCIHSYIAGTGLWSLQQGYHLTHFMDDFIKYYSKAPNYARNLIHSDVITIHNIAIPARTLYSYLLSHEKEYNMRVFVMSSELQESHDNEYVLIKLQSTPLVSYCDAHDTRYTDDFDVALIVSRVEQSPQMERTEITLKYYLMLTSKRELYPKREVENNKLGKFRTVYSVGKSTAGSYTDTSTIESSPVSQIPRPFTRDNSRAEMCVEQERIVADSNGVAIKDNDVKMSYNIYNNLAPTPPPVPNTPLAQNSSVNSSSSSSSSSSSPHLVQIRQESVNYLGYYSSHEQLMQQMIMSQAHAARQHITNMVERGALQCRTHLLWDKLLENKTSMTYNEFSELCSLAHIEPLPNLDPRLGPLVNQPVSWYQALSKVLQNKYQEHHKQFITSDGNVTHHLILHPTLLQAFMMLTIDLHTSRGDLCAVYRKSTEINIPMNMEEIYALVEGFVNACCFHLWMGLCSQ